MFGSGRPQLFWALLSQDWQSPPDPVHFEVLDSTATSQSTTASSRGGGFAACDRAPFRDTRWGVNEQQNRHCVCVCVCISPLCLQTNRRLFLPSVLRMTVKCGFGSANRAGQALEASRERQVFRRKGIRDHCDVKLGLLHSECTQEPERLLGVHRYFNITSEH